MDEGPGEFYAKWNKLIGERQVPYDFTYMWNLMNKINKMGTDSTIQRSDWQLWEGLGVGELGGKGEGIKKNSWKIKLKNAFIARRRGREGGREGGRKNLSI